MNLTTEAKGQKSSLLYIQAYEEIKRRIISGYYKPGEKLRDARLASDLSISHTPIREALQVLVNDGFLTKEAKKGVRVFEPTLKDIAEIYAARASLEGLAAALAAAKPEEEESKRYMLFLMAEEMMNSEQANRDGDFKKIAVANIAFHDHIVKYCGNENLRKILGKLRARTLLLRYGSLKMPANVGISFREHRKVFEMIKKSANIEVESYMRKHVLVSGYRLIKSKGIDDSNRNLLNYFMDRIDEVS